MKKLLITLGLLAILSQVTEAKPYIWNTESGSVKEESEVLRISQEENKAIDQSYEELPKDYAIIPGYMYNEKELEKNGLLIDTDTFDGVFFIDTDSGEFIEVKGFNKEMLKETDLAQGTFDGIEFRMVWGKLYVNTDHLKEKGILKDKSRKEPTFKQY